MPQSKGRAWQVLWFWRKSRNQRYIYPQFAEIDSFFLAETQFILLIDFHFLVFNFQISIIFLIICIIYETLVWFAFVLVVVKYQHLIR